MSDPVQHEIEIEVRYAETDQMGVVHHSNYLVWFELARTGLCSRSGYHYADVEAMGYLLMVTAADLSYLAGARYGDRVRVTAWVESMRSRTLRFCYEVHREDELLVTGSTQHVWIKAQSGRPCRIPEPIREPFERLAQGS